MLDSHWFYCFWILIIINNFHLIWSHYSHNVLTDFSHTVLSLVVSYCPASGATCVESACFTQQNHRITEFLKIWLYSTIRPYTVKI